MGHLASGEKLTAQVQLKQEEHEEAAALQELGSWAWRCYVCSWLAGLESHRLKERRARQLDQQCAKETIQRRSP